MSEQYDKLLETHRANVRKGYNWIKRSAPDILKGDIDYSWYIDFHDDTKTIPDEYNAYDEYLFGEHNKFTEQNFRRAKLQHIHSNPHHWQHWLLFNEQVGLICLEIPYEYIVEMICDWWSFSWKADDLYQIFDWYEAHKTKIKMHKKSRKELEEALDILYKAIERVRGPRK